MSMVPVDEPTAMSFTIPWTGNTIVTTAAVVTTCSASADCTDSATPTCSGSVCVTMSCGGCFTHDGAYDSLWDSVKPMHLTTRQGVDGQPPVNEGTQESTFRSVKDDVDGTEDVSCLRALSRGQSLDSVGRGRV